MGSGNRLGDVLLAVTVFCDITASNTNCDSSVVERLAGSYQSIIIGRDDYCTRSVPTCKNSWGQRVRLYDGIHFSRANLLGDLPASRSMAKSFGETRYLLVKFYKLYGEIKISTITLIILRHFRTATSSAQCVLVICDLYLDFIEVKIAVFIVYSYQKGVFNCSLFYGARRILYPE